jgi:NarL family two-component system response regulator YdfI
VLEGSLVGDGWAEPLRLLSPRERQVLRMTALGLTNVQIAGQLDVTDHAIKFHLSSIYRKLGVANRTEATAAFLGAQPRRPDR